MQRQQITNISSSPLPLGAIALVAIGIVLIQLFMVFYGGNGILDGRLIGGDSYMRLNRVVQLWQSGDWFDSVYHRINMPIGHVQHWTRPMDILLLIVALPATPFLGFESALHVAAIIVNPILHIVALILTIWTAAALIERKWLWLVAFLFILQPGLFNAVIAGRPDHQGLIIVTVMAYIGLNLRLLGGAPRRSHAIGAGIVGAFALWISIETMLCVLLAMTALAIRWLIFDRQMSRTIASTSVAMAVAILAALLIEHGPAVINRLEYDALSLAHLGLFAVNAAAWVLLAGLGATGSDATPTGRIIYGLAIAAVGGVILWLGLPGFFGSPLDTVDPLYRETRLVNIVEIMPMISDQSIALNGLWLELAKTFMWMGQPVVALAWALWLLFRVTKRRTNREFAAVWVLPTLGLLAFVPLTFAQVRWTPYLNLFSILVYAQLTATIVAAASVRLRQRHLTVARPLLVVALILWSYGPLAVVQATAAAAPAQTAIAGCDVTAAARHLGDPTGLGAQPQQIMAFVDAGPEILYRTPHSVLSIPNHRPQPGYNATYQAMTTRDFEVAEAALRRHHVDLVLVCDTIAIRSFYDRHGTSRRETSDAATDTPTLHEALTTGVPPGFLAPLDWPDKAGKNFKLYRVTAQN